MTEILLTCEAPGSMVTRLRQNHIKFSFSLFAGKSGGQGTVPMAAGRKRALGGICAIFSTKKRKPETLEREFGVIGFKVLFVKCIMISLARVGFGGIKYGIIKMYLESTRKNEFDFSEVGC